jgi:hypothetical protein
MCTQTVTRPLHKHHKIRSIGSCWRHSVTLGCICMQPSQRSSATPEALSWVVVVHSRQCWTNRHAHCWIQDTKSQGPLLRHQTTASHMLQAQNDAVSVHQRVVKHCGAQIDTVRQACFMYGLIVLHYAQKPPVQCNAATPAKQIQSKSILYAGLSSQCLLPCVPIVSKAPCLSSPCHGIGEPLN